MVRLRRQRFLVRSLGLCAAALILFIIAAGPVFAQSAPTVPTMPSASKLCTALQPLGDLVNVISWVFTGPLFYIILLGAVVIGGLTVLLDDQTMAGPLKLILRIVVGVVVVFTLLGWVASNGVASCPSGSGGSGGGGGQISAPATTPPRGPGQ